MRLNGWQRIGIVASVIWAIGAPHSKQEKQTMMKTFSALAFAART
jgi:hypothetical protein